MPSENPQDPTVLINGMVRQDRQAFKQFYDRYAALAYTFALRMLGSRPEAEDLIQEVFLQLWRQAASYDPKRGKPEAWVITITKSRAIDKIRSRRRKDMKAPDLEDQFVRRADEAENRRNVQNEVQLTVQTALDELSQVQREALELAYFDGLTQTEIAGKLDVPLGTVKTRIRDGLTRLRAVMKTKSGDKVL